MRVKNLEDINKLPPSELFGFTPDNYYDMSGTSKKVWLGIRMLRERTVDDVITVEMLDVNKVSAPESELGVSGSYYKELKDVTTDYTSTT